MAGVENFLINFNVLLRKRLLQFFKIHQHTFGMVPLIDADGRFHQFSSVNTYIEPYNRTRNKIDLSAQNPYSKVWIRKFFNLSNSNRWKEFRGRKLVGFSMEEMFDVINDVDSYKKFLPFCKKSHVLVKEKEFMKADLVIGFPPVVEQYTSHIMYFRPNLILAESKDAILFNHLVLEWKFTPGLSQNPRSCVIGFHISFEFKSIFHSQLANMFFNELVKQMESAFYEEAIRRYGKPTIPPIKLKVHKGSNHNSSPSSI